MNYIRGVTPTIARRILQYAFGDYNVKMLVNEEEKSYDCYVLDEVDGIPIDKDNIAYFKKYWTGFRILIVKQEK